MTGRMTIETALKAVKDSDDGFYGVLFVPAGVEHRFDDFSDDFAAWVVFFGPKGGEV